MTRLFLTALAVVALAGVSSAQTPGMPPFHSTVGGHTYPGGTLYPGGVSAYGGTYSMSGSGYSGVPYSAPYGSGYTGGLYSAPYGSGYGCGPLLTAHSVPVVYATPAGCCKKKKKCLFR